MNPTALTPVRPAPAPSSRGGSTTVPPGEAGSGRSLPMDMLRGIAILLVLGRHFVIAPDDAGTLRPLAAVWTAIGWAGVDLFFVVSGFLVSGLILAEYRQHKAVHIPRFVIRRGFKIWPPYLVYLAVLGAWIGWQHHAGRANGVWSELWPNLFHVQNYFHTPRVHTWSLAVEEHFYLGVALIFFLLLGAGRKAVAARAAAAGARPAPADRPGSLRFLPLGVAGLVLALAGFRHTQFLREGAAQLNLYATHLRCDGLLIGTLVAYWTHFDPAKLTRWTGRPLLTMTLGILLAAPILVLSPEANAWTAGVGLTAMYAGFALVMLGWLNLATAHPRWKQALATRPAAMLGRVGFYSYSIYLWHVDLAQIPMRKLVTFTATLNVDPGLAWAMATAIYVALAVVTGVLLSRWLEIPSLALRDRLFPSVIKPLALSMATRQRRNQGAATPAARRKGGVAAANVAVSANDSGL